MTTPATPTTPTTRTAAVRPARSPSRVPATPTPRPPREPALPLADQAAAADLRQQRGLLTDPFALFGTNGAVASEPPPDWLDDPEEVAVRVARKTADPPLTAGIWRAVADLAEACALLLLPREPHQLPTRQAITRIERTAAHLARRLPAPRIAAVQPRPVHLNPAHVAEWGPPTGAIELAALRLARALDDHEWTDPDALAGWIADTLTALTHYRAMLPDLGHVRRPHTPRRAAPDTSRPAPPAPRPAPPAPPTHGPAGTRRASRTP